MASAKNTKTEPTGLLVENLRKTFSGAAGATVAVDDVSFHIEKPEFFTMLGPSGCGKTTTLRMIAGLEAQTSGRIGMDGLDLSKVDPSRRNMGMVFQSYALFPHLSVFDNAAYGLHLRRLPGETIRRRIDAIFSTLGLTALARRYPSELSGGQQQRVAIARALVYQPQLLLLDEPLSNLDAKLRVTMREEILSVQRQLGITAIYVTHDQEEAMAISDRIAVFKDGRLIQVGSAEEIYRNPASVFVADFIGKANFFRKPHGAVRRVHVDRFDCDGLSENTGNRLTMVRPEAIRIGAEGSEGVVRRIQFLGATVRYIIDCPEAAREVIAEAHGRIAGVGEGDAVRISFSSEDAVEFVRP
jgi:iron(III) transport system ATP-binding protein